MGNVFSLVYGFNQYTRRQAAEQDECSGHAWNGPEINLVIRGESPLLDSCRRIHDDFVKTTPYLILEKQFLQQDVDGITIVGDTGDGKTAAAKNVAWELYESRKFIPMEVRTIAEIKELFEPGRNILFLVDDPFGACCVYSEFIRDWAVRLGELGNYLQTGRVKILVTLRKQIWEECKFDLKRLPPFATVLDISSSQLTRRDRRDILVQHLLSVDINVEDWSWKWKINEIVSSGTSLGFPYCCKLAVGREEFREDIVNFFDKPLEFIGQELRTLGHNSPELYSLLVLVMLKNGSLNLDELDPSEAYLDNILQQQMSEIFLACNVDRDHTRPTPRQLIQNLEKLKDIYLLRNETGYVFSHDSLLEAVALDFGVSNPQLLLRHAKPEFLVQAVRVDSNLGLAPNSGNFTVIGRQFHLQFAKIMTKELLEGHMEIVFRNPSWLESDFRVVWEEYVLNNIDMAVLLSKRGTRWQRTVLHCAAFRGLLPTVQFLTRLLEEKMKTITDKDGATVLHSAVMGGHPDVVRFLLKHFRPNVQDKAGWTPLYVAALCGHYEVAKLLLLDHADPNICTNYGSSPSYVAALCEHWDLVRLLQVVWKAQGFEACKSRDLVSLLIQQDNSRVTSLLRAVRADDQVEVQGMLDNFWVRVNEANSYGWTALYVSAVCGHFDMASMLLSRGADPHQPTIYGRTPSYVAEICGHVNILQMIRSCMNDLSSSNAISLLA